MSTVSTQAAPHERPEQLSVRALVTARDVTRRYGVDGDVCVKALRGVSLEVMSGRLTAVMGPSGSGKSTLMHILAGLDRPNEGEVTIAGTDITGLGDTELTKLRREHIGFIFQFFNLLPMLSAEENVVLPLKLAGEKPDREWVAELTTKVGLSERLKHRPSELSGGQQQRVAIARALAMQPQIILFDEPTSALDPEMINEVLEVMSDLARDGMTMMVVTHEMGFARRVAHRVVFMDEGQVVEEASPERFFAAARSERAREFLSKILSH
jgi:putative ABC transport system ATP-binding protein